MLNRLRVSNFKAWKEAALEFGPVTGFFGSNSAGKSNLLQFLLTPTDDDERGFDELPENDFDRSDRKFLAVAVVADAPVLNATDSDWLEHKDLMVSLGVEVHELCEHLLKGVDR